MCSTRGPDPPPHSLPHPKKIFPAFMPRRHHPEFYFSTLHLFCNQSVTYPSRRPSIRMLIRRIEALGYKVVNLSRNIAWEDIPQEYWGVAVTLDVSNTLLFIVPLSRRCRRLTRSRVFFGSYEGRCYFLRTSGAFQLAAPPNGVAPCQPTHGFPSYSRANSPFFHG